MSRTITSATVFLVDAGLFVAVDVARGEAWLEDSVNLVEGLRHEAFDFRVTVDDEGERGRLYSANGAQLPVVEGVGAREVESDEPVGVSACPAASASPSKSAEDLRDRNPSRMASSVRERIQSLRQDFFEPESW